MITTTERNPLAAAADSAVDQLQCHTERAKWLDALACAINEALAGGAAHLSVRVDRAMALTDLARHLAYEMLTDLEHDTAELQRAVDAAEAKE